MKDIQSLYLQAKNRRLQSDIDSYNEAVQELLENSPIDFLSNLKYIITSDMNLSRLDQFAEKYGISIAAYDQIVDCLNECVEKCEKQKIDSSLYKEYIEKYEMFKHQYQNCFMMFESFINDQILYEKSHGKLKYDFRYCFDYNTGHALKVVYSLDNIEILSVGSYAWEKETLEVMNRYCPICKCTYKEFFDTHEPNVGDESDYDPNEDYMDYLKRKDPFYYKVGKACMDEDTGIENLVKKYIRKKGNTDHSSKGQKVLAIVDRVTNGKLSQATTISALEGEFGVINSKNFKIDESQLKEIHNYVNAMSKSQKDQVLHKIKVGEVDNVPTFKSTKWFKGSNKPNPDGSDPIKKAQTAERMKFGRGVEVDNFVKKKKNSINEYVNSYYSFNESGIQGRRLMAGMIGKFGEMAIPDIIITAERMGEKTLNSVLEYVSQRYIDPVISQWIVESVQSTPLLEGYDVFLSNNFSKIDANLKKIISILTDIAERSAGKIAESVIERNKTAFQEAAIMGSEDVVYEISESEIETIKDLIEMKEYQITCLDDSDKIMSLQEQVYSLYESLDGIVDESGDVITEGFFDIFKRDPNKKKKKKEIQKAVDNLNELSYQIENFVDRELKEKIDKFNESRSWFSNERLRYPYVYMTVGDKYGPSDGGFDIKKRIKDAILTENDKGFLDDFRLWITLDIRTTIEFSQKYYDRATNIYFDMINDIIQPLIAEGKISLEKKPDYGASGDIEINTYKWYFAIRVNRSIIVKDVDLDLLKESVEEFDEIVTDMIIPLLPNGSSDQWKHNTKNKKTGQIPNYLGDNHDLGWGEDDSPKKPEDEVDEDDLRRPSAPADKTKKDDDWDSDDPDVEVVNKDNIPPKQDPSVNNYYYYTYTNSLNKNSHSFNKDNRTRDDHSSHDDHSLHTSNRRVTDDHSVGKRIHSDNYGSNDKEDQDETEEKTESTKPWELNIFPKKEVFTEGLFDIFKKDKPIKNDEPKEAPKRYFIPISAESKDTAIKRIDMLVEEVSNYVKPSLEKYSAYGLKISVDKDDIDDCFSVYSPSIGKLIDGVEVSNGEIYIHAKIKFSGYDQYDFMVELKQNHPDEVERLKEKYDINDRHDWGNIHWVEKICGYDRTLEEICNELTKAIMVKFPMISGLNEFLGDNDSGPIYEGLIQDKFVAPWLNSTDAVLLEAVGDADDMKPESDHPIKDTLQDIDRKTTKMQQSAKKKVQDIQNVSRAAAKPFVRAGDWISKTIFQWKDRDENKLKEKMADPHARSTLFKAISSSIKTGSLLKAGLLLNPVFLFLSITKKLDNHNKSFRIRNEIIGELKTELAIIDKKIKDADGRDNAAKYKLYRLRNEINKKLLRVGGSREFKKII